MEGRLRAHEKWLAAVGNDEVEVVFPVCAKRCTHAELEVKYVTVSHDEKLLACTL